MNPVPEEYAKLVCPNCRAGYTYLTITKGIYEPIRVECHRCQEHGTLAYFTPAAAPVKPRLIERTLHVDNASEDGGHVKAISAALALLARAADEEDIDIQWHTLRLVAAPDFPGDHTTYVVVVSAQPRVHARGGIARGFVGITVSSDASKDVDLDFMDTMLGLGGTQ